MGLLRCKFGRYVVGYQYHPDQIFVLLLPQDPHLHPFVLGLKQPPPPPPTLLFKSSLQLSPRGPSTYLPVYFNVLHPQEVYLTLCYVLDPFSSPLPSGPLIFDPRINPCVSPPLPQGTAEGAFVGGHE